MKETDVVIVGAGPAGTRVARILAKAGVRTLIVDKRQELGTPIQCSGAVSRHALLENEVTPDTEFIHESVYGFRVMDGKGGNTTIDYRHLKPETYAEDKDPLGYVVDRRRFDRYLLTQAEKAGAEAWLKAEAIGHSLENNRALVKIRHYNEEITVKTKVIVGADGVRSQVGKWAGLQTHIKLTELASCLQIVVDGVETNGLLELITGSATAPGGYAWVFPKGHGYAELGLGIIAPLTKLNAQQHLDKFIKESFLSDRFKGAKLLEVQGGGVPLAAPLKTQYADHIILVGDAARHVNPITGGGIHTALTGGSVAGHFLVEHLAASDDFTAKAMKGYQDNWLDATGHHMWKLYDIKREIFRKPKSEEQDELLFKTMSNYFSPNSEFKKV